MSRQPRQPARCARPPAAEAPGLVIVDTSDADAADGDLLERLTRHYAAAHFMLLTDNHHPDLLIRAMRAGVREVLQLPLVHRALHEAIDRIATSAGVASARDGKVLAFIACKGGSGATFISTNFGYALATLADKKVLLIDLHRQFGDATLYVSDQKPAMTLSDVCQQIAASTALPRILPGARGARLRRAGRGRRSPARRSRPSPSTSTPSCAWRASTTTTSCSTSGRQIDAVSLRALDSTDAIYPVLQLALPDIRDARRLLDIFRSLGYHRHIRLIVNRYEKGGRCACRTCSGARRGSAAHRPQRLRRRHRFGQPGHPVLQLARGSAAARSLADWSRW
jgi:pilus assembly protein CpaE